MRMKMMMSAVLAHFVDKLTHSPTGEHGIVKTQTSDLGATGMASTTTDLGATARMIQDIAHKVADAARSLSSRTPPAPVPI